jgi:hypothetical protein
MLRLSPTYLHFYQHFFSFYSSGIHLHKFHVTVGCGYMTLLPSCISKGTAKGKHPPVEREEVTAPDMKVFSRKIGI